MFDRGPGPYHVYLISDGDESLPLLWHHPWQPSMAAYPGAEIRHVASFAGRIEAREAFERLLERCLGRSRSAPWR